MGRRPAWSWRPERSNDAMILVIDDVMSPHEVAALREAAASLSFEDGRASAGRYARSVKHNEQAGDTPAREAIFSKVRDSLGKHPLVQAAARPRGFARLLVSRYVPGMTYGLHVDDAIMAGQRTDLSFTLCLSAAEDYEGGELVLEDSLESRAVHLDAGQMILYPSNTLHQVAPVKTGERLAVVGWITSWVPDPAQREVLFDLEQVTRELHASQGKTPAFDRLLKAKMNLMRMWARG